PSPCLGGKGQIYGQIETLSLKQEKEGDMGMDVIGQKPTSAEGEYFGNNVWWWRPLAEYWTKVAPEIASRCAGWQYNDGDGLNDSDSAALADALQAEINSGRCEPYARIRKSELEMLPNEICEVCGAPALSARRG